MFGIGPSPRGSLTWHQSETCQPGRGKLCWQYSGATPPGRHDHAWAIVYGYAVDASPTQEWLVITDGQQSGRWRLLHNSTGPGQRCSVGCYQRYQPTLNTAEQRKAQDYTFEALHRVYFYDAWRAQPVLNAPGSELVLPPQPGLLVHGCFWPQPSAPED